MAEFVLLSVPFTAALTIPMAVFMAVSWVVVRTGIGGTAAGGSHDSLRRLLVPVLGGGAVVAALMLVSNTALVPRANARLAAMLATGAAPVSDRTMTIGELRAAGQVARDDAGPDALARAASYEVEIQKKYALAAACLVLALTGVAIPLRVRHGGVGLVAGASLVVFGAYYLCLSAGESLADRLLVSPLVAMWSANVLLLAGALLLLWRHHGPGATRAVELATNA